MNMPTTDEEQTRIDEFIRTHVGRYVLPGKLAGAIKKDSKMVLVPVSDTVRLLARVGEHIVPVEAPTAPSLPAKLETLPAELADMFDWEPDGEAILNREQVEALIAQVARIAYATPRQVVRKKPTATITETIAAAIAADKRTVSIPTYDLKRMLEEVEAQREIQRETALEAVAA